MEPFTLSSPGGEILPSTRLRLRYTTVLKPTYSSTTVLREQLPTSAAIWAPTVAVAGHLTGDTGHYLVREHTACLPACTVGLG
jgi:hypothetical protein